MLAREGGKSVAGCDCGLRSFRLCICFVGRFRFGAFAVAAIGIAGFIGAVVGNIKARPLEDHWWGAVNAVYVLAAVLRAGHVIRVVVKR